MFDCAAFGPFIGDWKCEVFIFRPFIKWVTETINIDSVYISSHVNRLFLYDWIDDNKRIPVYEDISRDEISQQGFLHKNVSKNDYNLLYKIFKDDVLKKTDKYVNFFPLNYTKFFQYPFYCRVYSKINNSPKKIKSDYYLFIPDDIENINTNERVYSLLLSEYKSDLVICGDMRTHINYKNKVLSRKDYFKNGYDYIISYINNAKAVICPMGFWTFLSNLQDKPVFSWTTNKGNTMYRNLLKNNNYCIIQTSDTKMILNGFKNFVKKM